MVKNHVRRNIIVIISSIIGLTLIITLLAITITLYNNSLELGKFKAQCSELGIGTHSITYQGVATTLECDTDGNMYLPARN